MTSAARFQSSSITKNLVLVGLMASLSACSDDVMLPRLDESSARSFAISAGEDVVVSNLWVATGSTYNVVPQGHVVGALKYTDRNFTFSSIPTELDGYTFIRTANADRSALPGNTSFLRFTVDRAVTVYVAHRDGIFRPAWLNENFTDTGLDVLNSVYTSTETFSVFKRDYAAGIITLGSNTDATTTLGMYTVIVKPTTTTTTTTPRKGRTKTSPFKAVVYGVRPRGFGASGYTLSLPASGATTYYVSPTGDDANAGTSTAPFRTINRAAQVAVAGDVVNIANGTYQESVFVQNSGTATKPIVFQAQNRGGVVLTGGTYTFQPAGWNGGKLASGGIGVTLKGLIFRSYSDPYSTEWGAAAVRAAKNWRIEDCLFDKAGQNGVFVVDDSVTITKSTLQYNFFHALVAFGKGNYAIGPTDPRFVGISALQLTDVVLKGNFTSPTAFDNGSSGVIKIMGSKGLVVDNMESSQNNGPGLWLDADNFDYVIRNSYFHDNYTNPGISPGRGIHLELSWGPGLVENNVIANNGAEGLAISNTWGVEVRNNLFVGNRECTRVSDWVSRSGVEGQYAVKNISIHHNQFKDWALNACNSPYGDRPGGLNGSGGITYSNILIDYNTYEPVRNKALSGWWGDKGFLYTISDMQAMKTELNGTIGTVQWPL